LSVIDQLRERVQLAAGLDDSGNLTAAAQERAQDALLRFGERLRDLPQGSVRAVGTNTLRKARNTLPFLIRAGRALGHPIEVVSGREEARLIYLGVAHDRHDEGGRLVIDIGGGSTELIVGVGRQTQMLDSLYMGCVSWTARFFPDGQITRAALDAATTAALLELEPIARRYKAARWKAAVGSSGTILAAGQIAAAAGWSSNSIGPKELGRIEKLLLAAGSSDKLELPGLKPDRRGVFAGGFAVLRAVFEALDLDDMQISEAAMREGILVDLVGRIHDEDARDASIQRLQRQFQLDEAHADRVGSTALGLLRQARGWRIDVDEWAPLLMWASAVHEIGMVLSWAGYHKHGAYMLQHVAAPGFSRQDQQMLAALVLAHRGRFSKSRLRAISPHRVETICHLAIVLRLAVRLHRDRSPRPRHLPGLRVQSQRITLTFEPGWLASHPLTGADMLEEAALLEAGGFELVVA
jgi:exopolyphosphatase / guanosine-5'-triphosphate,3'-diphosphate pyrophosphatase